MKTKTKLNIACNNTDRSVSIFGKEPELETKMNALLETPKSPTPHAVHHGAEATKIVALAPNNSVSTKSLDAVLIQARRDAESLAWATGLPGLFLPCLLEEKETEARHYWHHQQEVHTRSADYLLRLNQYSNRLAA